MSANMHGTRTQKNITVTTGCDTNLQQYLIPRNTTECNIDDSQ